MDKVFFAESVHGAMHKERGMPKEDAAGRDEGEGFQIFVTADGHGDKECIRSAKGAELAVRLSIDCLTEFYNVVSENDLTEELLDSRTAENRIRKLIGSIIGKWNIAVNNDAVENPFTEDELATAVKCGNLYRNHEHISHAYGTTLLAGLLTEKYLLLIHQGDGHCVVIDAEGKTVEPVPWDDNCISNVVTSICDEDALTACRYAVVPMEPDKPVACFLASDGVDDSFFSMEETYDFCHRLVMDACEKDTSQFLADLPSLLGDLSVKGSRDDTSISGFIDIEKCRPFIDSFRQYGYRLQLESNLKRVQDKLKSMSRKKAYLEEQAQSAIEGRRKYEEKSKEKKTIISEISQKIKCIEESLSREKDQLNASTKDYELINGSFESAKAEEEKIIQERDEYLALYHQYEEEAEKLEKQILELSSGVVLEESSDETETNQYIDEISNDREE